jgi:hypothetical protein
MARRSPKKRRRNDGSPLFIPFCHRLFMTGTSRYEKAEAWEIDPVTGEDIRKLEAWHVPQTPAGHEPLTFIYTSGDTMYVSREVLNRMRKKTGGSLEDMIR